MINRIRTRLRRTKEHGAALIWVAGSMVALLGMTALAVDLGWYYLNGARLQRAADAAALAGVMHLPAAPAQAATDAETAARVNDFAAATLSGVIIDDNRYEVTLSADVPTFFAAAVGIQSLPLARTATAEYVKPVPMGSPYNTFGNGFDPNQSFWAAINGPFTAKEQGDPYMPRCVTATTGACNPAANPTHRPTGYYYGIEIPSGAGSFSIDVYDAGHYNRPNASTETGDLGNLTFSGTGGATVNYQVYGPDSTPLDPADNAALSGCAWTIDAGANPGTYRNQWATLCSRANPTPGIYVLRVWTSGTGAGSNHYGIRVTTAAGSAKVYGINDMSVFTNNAGGTGVANIYLAEIEPLHAGKKLELRFYDAGESSGNAFMTVRTPTNAIPNCNWRAENEAGAQTASGSGPCSIQTTVAGTARFNGQWITATIEIPDAYTCTSNCWWKMDLQLNVPHDRTTWEARVIGNPVRLVPND